MRWMGFQFTENPLEALYSSVHGHMNMQDVRCTNDR